MYGAMRSWDDALGAVSSYILPAVNLQPSLYLPTHLLFNMASVVVQQSPALTPTGGPPSSSPFVPAPDSSPYSRPHPPTTSDSQFPGSYPSETQLKEPKDAIDHLADAAPQSGGSILPVPGAVMQGVQNVLSVMNETAKAYLPASIGNALREH